MPSARSTAAALAVALLSLAPAVSAQATTTSLGTYLICRTTPGAAGCFELGLTTAARVNGSGVRDGTTGVVQLRNLQGSTVATPGGGSLAASDALLILRQIEFVTPGCLPAQLCGVGDYFGGIPSGGVSPLAVTTGAAGVVSGTPAGWFGTAEVDGSASRSILSLSATTASLGSNIVYQGLGGCTAGTATVSGMFNTLATTAVRTCDATGATGALTLAFATNAIFDPTFFWEVRLRFFGKRAPGSGTMTSFFCGVGANRRGEVLFGPQGGGECSGFAASAVTPPGVVPEPDAVVLLATGLAGLAVVVGRRRRV